MGLLEVAFGTTMIKRFVSIQQIFLAELIRYPGDFVTKNPTLRDWNYIITSHSKEPTPEVVLWFDILMFLVEIKYECCRRFSRFPVITCIWSWAKWSCPHPLLLFFLSWVSIHFNDALNLLSMPLNISFKSIPNSKVQQRSLISLHMAIVWELIGELSIVSPH